MAKLTQTKIQNAMQILTLICVGFTWWSDRSSDSAAENSAQTQQIVALNEKMDQFSIFFDKRLDRLENKMDSERK